MVTSPLLGYRSTRVRTVLLYVQDARGLGHLSRGVTIARHILAAYPDTVVFMASRSPILHNIAVPAHCFDYIKLPTRHTPQHIQRPPDDHEASLAQFRRLRSQLLRDTALGLAPDIVLVDHEPLGAGGEFRDGLWTLKAESPHTRFVFGLRDIMDDAEQTRAEWRAGGVYKALEQLYDGIAVYGSPQLLDVADAYALPASVRLKLHYCGYIVRERPVADPAAIRECYGLPAHGPLVLAAVGSGYDGYPVLEGALTAVERIRAKLPRLCAIVVTGPFMRPEQRASLMARATPACRVVPQADTFALMTAADAIVSMGGYNSVCEALVSARPLVIVPRAKHKVEQRIRAELLAARGLARWVHPDELNSDALPEALEWALRRDPVTHARRVREVFRSFDGAIELNAYLSRWLGEATHVVEAAATPESPGVPEAAARLAQDIYAVAEHDTQGDPPSVPVGLAARIAAALHPFKGWRLNLMLNALSRTRATPEELEEIRKLLDDVKQGVHPSGGGA